MNTIKAIARSGNAKLTAAAVVVATVLGFGGMAGAVTDPVQSGFTSMQTSLTTDLGYAIVLVVALAAIAIGIRLLVKWAKRASAS